MSGESAVSVHVIDVLLMDRTCKKGWMHSVLFVRSTVARMKEVLKYNDGSLGGELQRELARWQQRAESQRIRFQWIGSHKCAHGTGLAHKCPLALIVRRDPSWQVELHNLAANSEVLQESSALVSTCQWLLRLNSPLHCSLAQLRRNL